MAGGVGGSIVGWWVVEVHDFCVSVRSRLLILRITWDEKSWRDGVGAGGAGDDGEFKPQLITELLCDPYFFAYLDTVLALGDIPAALSGWAEGCCCHEDLLLGERKGKRSKKIRLAFKHSMADCPMKGKRLPELAVGALEPFCEKISSFAITDLMVNHQPWLQAEDWAKIVNIFELGKSTLWTGLQVKLDFAKRLPWRLAALTHHDQDIARFHTKEIVSFFDSQDSATQDLHHALVIDLLGADRPARRELIAFADGRSSLAELPLLSRMVLPLKFVPIVERYIEAQHALVKRSVPHRHAPVMVSLAVRLPRLEDSLQKEPSMVQDLLDCFDKSRITFDIPALLGIQTHPSLLTLSRRTRVKRDRDDVIRMLNNIIYRADIAGQFHDTKAFQKDHTARQDREDKLAKAVVAEKQPQLPASYNSVLRCMITSHFQAIASCPEEKLTLFSLPSRGVATKSGIQVSLWDAMSCATKHRSSHLALECDVELHGAPEGDGSDGQMFFTVVKANPGAWHTVCAPWWHERDATRL